MTPKEMAAVLHGREIGQEVTMVTTLLAKTAGLVIVYGASDDLIEFDGAIREEAGCYSAHGLETTQYFVNRQGLLRRGRFAVHVAPTSGPGTGARTITANWDEDGYSWTYTTDIPHETFDIMEDGEYYCRGIVFRLEDL